VADLAETGDIAVDADIERAVRQDQIGILALDRQ
jgi:hypothetical protein